jgi:hypothetical protein
MIVSNGGSKIPSPRSVAMRNGLNDLRNHPAFDGGRLLLLFLTAGFSRVDLSSEFIEIGDQQTYASMRDEAVSKV